MPKIHAVVFPLLPNSHLRVFPFALQVLRWHPEENSTIKSKTGGVISSSVLSVHRRSSLKSNLIVLGSNPKFTEGTGCYRYIRIDVDDTIRYRIDYGSEEFKRIYNLRTSSERLFSRLLSVLMQEPSVKGLTSTANNCTLAHITVLAVAYFATVVKEQDKIRFVKSFLQNF